MLLRNNRECAAYASRCIHADPTFVFGYLHRARAFRCLELFEDCVKDLRAALELRTGHSPDINRELTLVEMEQRHREQYTKVPSNHFEILGLSKDLDKENIVAAYRRLLAEWHPSKRAKNSVSSEV